MFDSLLSITNEFERVKLLFLTPGTSKELQIPVLGLMSESIEAVGHENPELLYTDQCCHDRNFYETHLPSLKVDTDPRSLIKFPKLELPSEPVFISTIAQCGSAVVTICELLIWKPEELNLDFF